MTRTVSMSTHYIRVSRFIFIPARNKFRNADDFIGITKEKHEKAKDILTGIPQEEKKYEFENVRNADLISS